MTSPAGVPIADCEVVTDFVIVDVVDPAFVDCVSVVDPALVDGVVVPDPVLVDCIVVGDSFVIAFVVFEESVVCVFVADLVVVVDWTVATKKGKLEHAKQHRNANWTHVQPFMSICHYLF